MKLSAQSHASIASSLREAVDKYIADGESGSHRYPFAT